MLVDNRLAPKVFHGHLGTQATAIWVRKPRPFGYGILYIKPLVLPVVAQLQSCESVENENGAPFGRTCCAYIGGRCAPPNHPATKRSASTRRSASVARIQREGASASPAPTPRKCKSKNLAVDGGVGPAFVPECRAARDRTESPQDEHGAMPPAPVYPKCVYGHSATGPRVMNPAFHLAGISRVAAAESGINR
jgi:hypothetical protein